MKMMRGMMLPNTKINNAIRTNETSIASSSQPKST